MPHEPSVTSARRPRDLEPGDVRALTLRVVDGDPEALTMLYEARFQRIHENARRLTGRDESFCLDVVQEAILRIVRGLRPVDDLASLDAFIDRVTHSTAIDLLRHESRLRRRTGAPREEVQAIDERVQWVRDRLDDLPESDRLLFRLRFGSARSLEEIGDILHMTGGAAHGRLRRALDRLRRLATETFHDHE